MEKIVFTPVGENQITCDQNCFGRGAILNSLNENVCNVTLSVDKEGFPVVMGTRPDDLRICIMPKAEENS